MTVNYDKFWEEIVKEAQEEILPPQENEVTVELFATMSKQDYHVAYGFLEKGVRKGKIGKRYAKLNGHRTAIYHVIF